jgi:TolA-binding protein
LLLCEVVVCDVAFSKASIRGEISRVADTSHLEFEGLKSWTYNLDRPDKSHIVLTVPPFDAATEAKLRTFADNFIKNVKIEKSGPDESYQVIFELADSSVESFDYLTDEPSRLIIDFYKKAPEALKALKPEPPKKPLAKKDAKFANEKKSYQRKPTSDEILQVAGADSENSIESHTGAFDAGDANFDRFRLKDYEIREESILASGKDIFLLFPILKMPVSRLDQLIADQPEYVINPKESRENKEARLLLVLYSRGRANVFLKTLNYFETKYPESDYLEILRNMAAAIHLKEWKNAGKPNEYEAARDAYTSILKKYPDSPLKERNNLILAYMALERGEALSLLQQFQSFVERFPKSPEVPQARKAIAEAFLLVNKFDSALAEYKSIAADYPKTPAAIDARFRLGDVEFSRENFPATVTEYLGAIKDSPDQSKNFPNAHFNMAEALFWKKDYKASLNEFVNFLTLFPSHPFGGYAMTRIGELMSILGVDPRRSMGAYLESTFRYPENPGSKIARLRMLAQQLRTMRPKELKKALEEIKGAITEVKLPGMEEFATVIVAEGFQERGEYTRALTDLLKYYQDHPMLKNRDQFTERIVRNIASEIKNDVDQGKFLNALKFESQYSKTWLHTDHRIDVDYLRGRAFEQAGAWDEADKIYRGVFAELAKIHGTQEEKRRRAVEFIPKNSSLMLRLAAVAVEKRQFVEAYQHLRGLEKVKDLSEPEEVERAGLIARVSEFRGEWSRSQAALTNLVNHWTGEPELLNPALIHLAELELRTNHFEKAEANLEKVLEAKDLKESLRAKALEMKADSLLGQKRTMAAIELYQSLLEQFENKQPLGSVRYKVGQLLFDRGDVKGAELVWGKLQGGSNEILSDMAKEKLSHAKWQDEFHKYVERIPAMKSAAGEEKK